VANIDIPVGPELQKALALLPCPDISIKNPKPITVKLPMGGSLSSINDLSRGIPTDCSMTFSLLLQLGPLLAALHCPMAILKLIGPLMDAVKNPPPTPETIKKLDAAMKELAPCLGIVVGAGVPPFVIDILRLIRRVLGCLVGQLKTVAGLMSGYALAIGQAEDDGNDDLLDTLRCAQKDAQTAAEAMTSGIEPVAAILAMLKPFFDLAQMSPITLPGGGGSDNAEALYAVVATLEDVLTAIDAVIGEE
jgi:hypothetical protein